MEVAPLLGTDVSTSVQDDYVSEWIKTEETLKLLEQSQGVLLVPAYIGLRNSGRCFVDALHHIQAGEKEEAEASLRKSVDELKRSRHDALRAQVEFCHYRLLIIEESYPSDRIYQVCPEYFEIQDKIEEVNIRLNSDFANAQERDEYYQELEKFYLPQLLNVFSKLTVARSAALEEIKRNDLREESYKKLAIAGFGVGLVGIALAALAFFI